ncbi:putative monooxygenase [Gymnopus androsaceus JB14]|uniref:Monooxygenase n=1 Tax=Gymnopus androsaceus JB14 TaxID=1447944 RepID=A0A6A4INS2_9AGAR|nr:putative monooxygenase [Gymnopus androsaceus JB14]
MSLSPRKELVVLKYHCRIGGISFAIALQRKFPGFNNFTIYEKGNDVGGTWRVNTYPGCACDVPVHFFSSSSDLKPDWDNTHAYQPQIYQYWKDLATKYQIYPYIQFNTLVTSAEWNSETHCYQIVTKNLASGEETTSTAEILVSALGILEVTKLPDIHGISLFKGEIFHSAAWNHNVDLSGKRVAVIGNGASATQFVPLISQNKSVKVVNFCRTPNWFIWPLRATYNKFDIWMFKNLPLWIRIYRAYQFFKTEFFYFTAFKFAFTRRIFTFLCKLYIKHTAPKKDVKNLIPTYTMGCKRVIFDSDYLASLHRPNVSLNWDGIESISEDGIVTKTGEKLPFDVIICATGFITDQFPLHVKGTQNTIQEYYDAKGGPTAFLATTIPEFPNFFMLGGPNATTGTTSVIYTEENQSQYILKLIAPIINHPEQVCSIGVTAQATDKYNNKLQADLNRSVFVDCTSYYRKGRDGKVSSAWPYSASWHWWIFRNVQLAGL